MSAPRLKEVILPQHRMADGSYAVKIRLTHNRKVKYLPTSEIAKVGDYDKDLRITSRSILRRLLDTMDNIEEIIKKKGDFQVASMTVHELADYIAKAIAMKDGFRLDFFEFGRSIADSKPKYSGNNYRTALNSFATFNNTDSMDISLVTSSLMRRYEKYLVEKYGKGARAISLYTSSIAAIHSEARKIYNDNESGDLMIRNPFEFYTPPKQTPAQKRTLDKSAIQKLIDIRESLEGSHRFAVDMFLLSFSLMGTNVPDLYCATLQDNTIHYCRTKTKERRYDNAEMFIRIEPQVEKLFEEYADPHKIMAFNFSRKYDSYKSIGRLCNIRLKEVAKMIKEKPFSMYAARHTWATLAYEIGIPMEIINDCLCHVDTKMAVTDIYIKKDWKKRWEANKKVLSRFNWK